MKNTKTTFFNTYTILTCYLTATISSKLMSDGGKFNLVISYYWN
jgi:hypothetical protein